MTTTRCSRCARALVGRVQVVCHPRVRLDEAGALHDDGDRAPDERLCERCVDDEENPRRLV